jgi:hypothetical protein
MKARHAFVLIALALATLSPLWAEELEAIRNIRYATTEQVLTVTFGDGSRYTYAAVPAAIAEELEKAESKGEAFNRLIKGKYVGTKIVVE